VAEVRVPACRDAEILAALARALPGRKQQHVLVLLRVGFSEADAPVLLEVGAKPSACAEAAGLASQRSSKLVFAWFNRVCDSLPRFCARRVRAVSRSRVAAVVHLPDTKDSILGLPVSRSIGVLNDENAPFSLAVSRSEKHVFLSAAGSESLGPMATADILAGLARELKKLR
jgi:hypothetical protein